MKEITVEPGKPGSARLEGTPDGIKVVLQFSEA